MAPPRPRWEANKKQAPAKAQKVQKPKAVTEAPAPSIPLELQQLLLNIFKDSFADRFATDIRPLLQEVKGHLYNRDFAIAFGKSEYLETYAARWSASRALGYAELFWDLRAILWHGETESEGRESEIDKQENVQKRSVICLGGGAGAELVALAGLQKMLSDTERDNDSTIAPGKISVEAYDMADWTLVIEQLAKQSTQAPPLSKYASAAIQAANVALVNPNSFGVTFHQQNILEVDYSILKASMENATLVTLMFTLNELYSTSLPLTQKFLLNLTSSLAAGAMLLVVDSPGSYSTIKLNGAEKKYPMQWLLDHTLLTQGGANAAEKKEKAKEDARWEKIHENESRWFRLAPTLQYPIELENMRMQVHLYRKL
jgi:25S rRNA (uracil2843-N3)-methyltransferase